MFSGKSTELQRRVRRNRIANKKTQIFRPAADARSPSATVESRVAGTMKATEIETLSEIHGLLEHGVQVIAIDECQFLPGIADFCMEMAAQGFDIVVSGLDFTFEGKPFTEPEFGCILNVVADDSVLCKAVCVNCGDDNAIFTKRIGTGTQIKQVGGTSDYQAMCRTCFT